MELGKNIIKIRKENNLTQDDLADKYYVTRQTISNWENGKTYPDLETLLKISDDFNISLDILLKEDREMITKIDTSVKAKKKYKNLLKYVIIAICLLLFFGYKLIMLNKYKTDEIEIDRDAIFNDTMHIDKENYSGDRITIDNMSFANYFKDYQEAQPGSYFKAKRNKDDEVISFYGLGSTSQYINVLNVKSFELSMDDNNNELSTTSNSMKKFLDKNEINDDIDLLIYIKENYYFKNNILTFTSTMEKNYILNSFVDSTLFNYGNVTLISGDNTLGYVVTLKASGKYPIREIHLLHNDKQYILTLCGEDISKDEFITKLLSTVEFN